MFQSGDVTHYDERGGESVVGSYGGAFEDELDDDLKHRGPGEDLTNINACPFPVD